MEKAYTQHTEQLGQDLLFFRRDKRTVNILREKESEEPAWWPMSIIPGLRRRRQGDCCKFKANLGYRANSSPARTTYFLSQKMKQKSPYILEIHSEIATDDVTSSTCFIYSREEEGGWEGSNED